MQLRALRSKQSFMRVKEELIKRISWISFQMLDLFLSKTALIEVSKNLAELGITVDFFALRSNKIFGSNTKNMHLIVFPIKAFPFISHMIYTTLVSLILPFYVTAKRPDFIFTEPKFGSFLIGLEVKLIPKSMRPKLILDIRSTPVEVHDFRGKLGDLFFRFSVVLAERTFNGITIATESMKKELCNKFHIKPDFIYVWSNGVDLALFNSEKYNKDELRRKLSLDEKFVVFYHGSFAIHRGILETIESIKDLKNEYPDIVIFLLGTGQALNLIKLLIVKYDLQKNVILHHPVEYDEVPKFIAVCDVAIVPLPNISDWRHQCPLKLIEYLAMKKAVILTDIPANRGIAGNTKAAIYISSSDPKSISRAIKYAYNNRSKLNEWGSFGREIVEEKYDWKKIAEGLKRYMQRLACIRR
jgi:glycosyltransferase involved in cell wall biosynthesis